MLDVVAPLPVLDGSAVPFVAVGALPCTRIFHGLPVPHYCCTHRRYRGGHTLPGQINIVVHANRHLVVTFMVVPPLYSLDAYR